MSAALTLSSCGNSATKKAQKEAQQAELKYKQTVVENLNSSIDAANKLIREFNSMKPEEMVGYDELEHADFSYLKLVDNKEFDKLVELQKALTESTISDVQVAIAQAEAIKKMK